MRWRNPYKVGTREYVIAHRDKYLKGVRVFDSLPEGWKVNNRGALTNPTGSVWCDNGKSLFGGEYEHALLYVGGRDEQEAA